MGMLKEFKDFAMKGNLVDIAVGFVMGAGFNKVVASFTGGIVSPLIGLLGGKNFKDLKFIVKEGVTDELTGKVTGEVAVLYGDFITAVIDFIIVAFVMFVIVKGVNAMKKKEKAAPVAPSGPTQEELLAEIRDLLKKN